MLEKFSFSKLTSFNTCKYNYYLTYIEKLDGIQNIYGELGTSCHECIEGLIKNELTIEGAKAKFNSDLDTCDMLELEFPKYKGSNEMIRRNYVDSIHNYFDNFELFCDNPDYESIEEYFELEMYDVIVRGYIDYYYIKGNDLYIIDFKTSSKFTKQDLEKKKLQLIIYGLYLRMKYPDKKIHLAFDMLKYVMGTRGGLKERHKLAILEGGERGFVWIEFDDENIQQALDFIKNTISEINNHIENKLEWTPKAEPTKDYFCNNLCGNKVNCKYYKGE